jgi:hypothetical protein
MSHPRTDPDVPAATPPGASKPTESKEQMLIRSGWVVRLANALDEIRMDGYPFVFCPSTPDQCKGCEIHKDLEDLLDEAFREAVAPYQTVASVPCETPATVYHCVTQLGEHSWEYRIKGPDEPGNVDDLVRHEEFHIHITRAILRATMAGFIAGHKHGVKGGEIGQPPPEPGTTEKGSHE